MTHERVMRLAHRGPLDFDGLLAFLGERAVPGVEEVRDGEYRRVLRLAHGLGVVALGGDGDGVTCRLWLDDASDHDAAVALARRAVDLDADPAAIAERLGADPLLGPLVQARPGLRVPGHVDPHELAFRAVLGQQVSVAAARTLASRLAVEHGEPLPPGVDAGALAHAFPTAAALAELDPETLPMPRSRGRALVGLASALASGEAVLEYDGDLDRAERGLLALPGIGPWTTSYIRMRALGDPDAFLPTDLGVRHALEGLGQPADARSAAALAEGWRPWRSYALMHLWATLALS